MTLKHHELIRPYAPAGTLRQITERLRRRALLGAMLVCSVSSLSIGVSVPTAHAAVTGYCVKCKAGFAPQAKPPGGGPRPFGGPAPLPKTGAITGSCVTCRLAVEGGSPRSFALAVAGPRAGGTIVHTKTRAPNNIGLVVGRLVSGDKASIVGDVPLGAVASGTHSIPWDLRVNGGYLHPGRYTVNLGIFTPTGQPTGYPPAPAQAVLSIAPNGSFSVNMRQQSGSGSSGSGLSGWGAALVGLGGVVVGLLVGLGRLGSRRRKNRPAAAAA
jgi:hypothetical protein